MKLAFMVLHRWRCAPLSVAVLVALLQRTPVLRLAATAGEALVAAPLGAVLRPALTGLASLGAVQALAGATQFVFSRPQPIVATVGTPIASLLFTVTGTPGDPPASFRVEGLPPGLVVPGVNGNGVLNASSGIISGTPTVAGRFQASARAWRQTNMQGDSFGPVTIVFEISGGGSIAPAITTQPADQSVVAGGTAVFSAGASGSPAPALQWRRNGAAIAGATGATLELANAQPADAGDYTLVATNSAGTATSNVARLTVTAPPPAIDPAARLSNLSVRTPLAAAQTLIVGVVVRGGSRDVLVRAAGPALSVFGLAGAMADPRLELFDGATSIFSNDDWPATLANTFVSVGAFSFGEGGSRDAAFLRPLAGAASVQARGTGAGILLVEAYDTGAATAAKLVNVSARNRVGTGADILIAGFTVMGSGAKRLLIRAIGPRLAAFGVTGFLADPVLEIYNGAGVLQTSNDNWSAELAATFTAVGAFDLVAASRDAALVAVLPPGSYTAQVRGTANGTGEALVEIYEAP
jgi:hypothetical protein